MLPNFDQDSRFTRGEILVFTVALIGTTMASVIVPTTPAYWGSMLLAGGVLLYHSVRLAEAGSKVSASRLPHASVLYLPVVLAIMALSKRYVTKKLFSPRVVRPK